MKAMVFDSMARHNHGILSIESFREAIGGDSQLKPAVNKSSKRSIILREDDKERMPTLDEAEVILIEQALEQGGGNQGIAAIYLGISRNALNKKIIRART